MQDPLYTRTSGAATPMKTSSIMASSSSSLSTYELCSQSVDSNLSDLDRQVFLIIYLITCINLALFCSSLCCRGCLHAIQISSNCQAKSHPPVYCQLSGRNNCRRQYILPHIRGVSRILHANRVRYAMCWIRPE